VRRPADLGHKLVRAPALFIAALWAAAAAPALAGGSRLDAILERQELRVGTTGDYRPFTILDKGTGEYSGFDIEMARGLAKALGVSIAFAPTTWSSLATDLAADDFDIAMGGVSVTLDRQKSGFFSAPYIRDGKTPIARCADKEKFATLADIDRSGVKVIANPGGTNERFDRARLHAAQIVVYPDNLTIFDQLAAGRADLVITDASETPLPGAAASGRPLRHPSRPAVRFRRESLLDVARSGSEGLRRPMAASDQGKRRIRHPVRQVVPLTIGSGRMSSGG
jgi:cyclohexadienyl dehydratase